MARPTRRKIVTAAVSLMLLITSCSATSEIGADDPGTTTPTADRPEAPPNPEPDEDAATNPGDEGGAFDDPTAGPDRAPDEPRIVPPLVLPAAAPGTDAAAAELIEDLERLVTPEQLAEGVPWPDLRNPDPVASYRSDAAFQNWMAVNNPTPTLVEAYTAPGSPERAFDLELFDVRDRLDLRAGPADPPYSMRVEELVHPAATGITDTLLAQVPEGSVAVVYFDSVGPSDDFTSDGTFWGSSPGWIDAGPWVAIMAPTDVGWQVWWDELTEPPPPGSRQQRGVPSEGDNRSDL